MIYCAISFRIGSRLKLYHEWFMETMYRPLNRLRYLKLESLMNQTFAIFHSVFWVMKFYVWRDEESREPQHTSVAWCTKYALVGNFLALAIRVPGNNENVMCFVHSQYRYSQQHLIALKSFMIRGIRFHFAKCDRKINSFEVLQRSA